VVIRLDNQVEILPVNPVVNHLCSRVVSRVVSQVASHQLVLLHNQRRIRLIILQASRHRSPHLCRRTSRPVYQVEVRPVNRVGIHQVNQVVCLLHSRVTNQVISHRDSRRKAHLGSQAVNRP
jgi:hypothetical protein